MAADAAHDVRGIVADPPGCVDEPGERRGELARGKPRGPLDDGGVYTSGGLYGTQLFPCLNPVSNVSSNVHWLSCGVSWLSAHLSGMAHGFKQSLALAIATRAVAVARTPWSSRPNACPNRAGNGFPRS